MKGPFPTYDHALAQAKPGEIILARDSRHCPEQGWCVVSESEANAKLHPYCFEGWVFWERIKEPL